VTDEGGSTRAASLSSVRILFSTKLLKITVTLCAIWFTLSFGSYGLSTWISTLFTDIGMLLVVCLSGVVADDRLSLSYLKSGLTNPYFSAFIFAIAQLPGNVLSILYIESVGRRQ
jgi:VNT family MFS transporter (synaptic vesicle glycoprotein 2)